MKFVDLIRTKRSGGFFGERILPKNERYVVSGGCLPGANFGPVKGVMVALSGARG